METKSSKETFEYAASLARESLPGDVYALIGEMGVGKTVFAKGFAQGLGVSEVVSSPTFTIVREYEGKRCNLYHFDLYRIGEAEEMDEIGFEDYLFGDGVCLIEWADLFPELLPENTKYINIKRTGDDTREITIG